MRALVIGASGLLGQALIRAWSGRGWEVSGTTFSRSLPSMSRLDLRDPAAVKAALARERPEVVALPASNPHVDYCESHPEETRALNQAAPLAAARLAAQAGARVLFFSSDYVFDGARGGYKEGDAVRPLNEYGRQKAAVERGLAPLGDRCLTLRISALFGWELSPKNFVLQVLERLGRGERMRVASDQDYNPTYCPDLAEAAADLVEKGASGVLHAAGSETLTRAGFASEVAARFGLDPALLEAGPLQDLLPRGAAPRPLHSGLDSSRAAALLGRPLWGVRRALEHMASTRAQWKACA